MLDRVILADAHTSYELVTIYKILAILHCAKAEPLNYEALFEEIPPRKHVGKLIEAAGQELLAMVEKNNWFVSHVADDLRRRGNGYIELAYYINSYDKWPDSVKDGFANFCLQDDGVRMGQIIVCKHCIWRRHAEVI